MDRQGVRKSPRFSNKPTSRSKNTVDTHVDVDDDEQSMGGRLKQEKNKKSVLRVGSPSAMPGGSKRGRPIKKDMEPAKKKKKQLDERIKPRKETKQDKGKKLMVEATGAQIQGCSMKARTTPYPLFNAISSMSNEQLAVMDEMGFGGLYGMKMDGIPANLGNHVTLNFDPNTMTLNTSNGQIHVTEEAIRDMIGCPMGHIRYDSCETEDYGVGVRIEWSKQFNREAIRPTDVSRQIMLSNLADWNFKLNFIVVFCNTMGQCKYNGLCDLDVLSRVSPDTSFKDINWCGYILNCLKFCKNSWGEKKEKAFFCGPLATLVLLYVDNIKWDIPRIVRQRPAIKEWSFERLRVRVESEIEAGGLGLGEFEEPYVPRENNVEGNPPSSPSNVEEALSVFDDIYTKMVTLKTSLNTAIEKASIKFPGVEAIEKWRNKKGELFVDAKEHEVEQQNIAIGLEQLLHVEDLAIGETFGISTTCGGVQSEIVSDTQFLENPVVWESCDKLVLQRTAEKEKAAKDGAFAMKQNNVNPVTPIVTPKVTETTVSIGVGFESPNLITPIDKQQATVGSGLVVNDDFPNWSLGFTQEFGGDDVIGGTNNHQQVRSSNADMGLKVNMQDQNMEDVREKAVGHVEGVTRGMSTTSMTAEKREIKAGVTICSPYLNRKVDPHAVITKDETTLSSWIFSAEGDGMVPVFKTVDCKGDLERKCFESMSPGRHIDCKTIDAWSYILNKEEQFRNKSSTYRFFCTTDTLTEDMNPPKMNLTEVYDRFSLNLKSCMLYDDELTSLKTIDMIFFPIQQPDHFYVIVYNLKNPSIVILDNSASNMLIDDKYGELPTRLQSAMQNYLKKVGHPKVNSMSKVKPTRYKMKWRTIDNNKDSGIFAMRHMETFKGETVSRYNADLVKESPSHEVQLNKFRRKYLAKILLSTHNLWRTRVMRQATDTPLARPAQQFAGGITKATIRDRLKNKGMHLG